MSSKLCIVSADSIVCRRLCTYLADHCPSLNICCLLINTSQNNNHSDLIKGFPKRSNLICCPCDPTSASFSQHLNQQLSSAQCAIIVPSLCRDQSCEVMCDWVKECVDQCKSCNVADIMCVSWCGSDATGEWKGQEEGKSGAATNEDKSDRSGMRAWFVCEQACRAAYSNCCIIRCAFIQQWLKYCASVVSSRQQLCLPVGEARCAPLDVDDLCRCICTILDPLANKDYKNTRSESNNKCVEEKHWARTYQLAGPSIHDGQTMSHLISSTTNAPCEFKDCSKEEFKNLVMACEKLQQQQKVDEMMCCDWAGEVETMTRCAKMVKDNKLEWMSEDMKECCGKQGSELRNWVHSYKDEFTGKCWSC